MQLGPKTQAALAHYRQLKAIEQELEGHAVAMQEALYAWDEVCQREGQHSVAAIEARDAYWRLAEDPRTAKCHHLKKDISHAYVSLAATLLSEH